MYVDIRVQSSKYEYKIHTKTHGFEYQKNESKTLKTKVSSFNKDFLEFQDW